MGVGGTETKGGSLALGQSQFKLFQQTVMKDRKALERLITIRLIKPLVAANWGDVECKFEFNEFSEEDESEFSRIWLEAVKGKVFEPNDEEINHFRSQVKYPQGPIVIPEPEPSPFEDGKPFGGKPNKNGKEKDFTRSDSFQRSARRKLTVYERNKHMDVDSTVDILERSESLAMPRFRAAAKRIYQDFIDQTKESSLGTRFNPDRMNTLQPHFMREFNKIVKDHFIELFKDTLRQARLEVMPLSAKKMSVDDPFFPEQFEEFLKAQSFKIVGDYTDGLTKRLKNIINRGIRDGAPLSEIVKLMRLEAQDMTDTWLATVVRTETTSVYNQGRKSYWESDPLASQIVQGYQYSAIIDDRTTDVCEYLDGKIFDEGDFIDRLVPPLHFNCRSLLVPVTRFEDYRSDKNYVEPGSEPSIESLKEKGGRLILG
jgi:SPP1 gp7 family putative phage head morphogenesis protein